MADTQLAPGLTGHASLTVEACDLATALRSGDVRVLGTPRLIALCEEATVNAVHSNLPSSYTTVGTGIDIRHLAPTQEGGIVSARAVLIAAEAYRLLFEVEANEGDKLVAIGKIRRALVNRSDFLSNL